MSLLPSYTAPPAITWISSYWADDPKTGGGFINAGQDAVQSTEHTAYKALRQMASVNPLTFTRYDPLLNNRGSWTVPVQGGMFTSLKASDTTTIGNTLSVVWIGYLPSFTSGWASSGGPRNLTAPASWVAGGVGIGSTSGQVASLLDGNYSTYTNSGGANANYFTRRAVVGQPHMLTLILDGAGGARIMVNGETYGPGPYTDAGASLLALAMGGNNNEVAYRVGFVGWYDGDIRSDPLWSNFKTWVQNHYGFNPAVTYDASAPPPIPWRAEYLADDFDASTGWPDRTGRGYTLNFGGVYIASDGLRNGGSAGTSTNCAKIDNFAGLNFTGDFEVALRLKGSLPSSTVLCGQWDPGASYPASRWSLRVEPSNVLRMEFSDGATFKNMGTSTFPFLSGWESIWLRVAFIKNSGGNSIVRYYWSHDGSNWTQWGADVTTPTFSYPNVSNPFYVGTIGMNIGGYPPVTCIQRVILKDGINGTTVVDADFDAATPGVTSFTESSVNARTVNILSSAPTKVTNVVNGQPVVRFDGVDDYIKASGLSLAAPLTVVAVARARGTVTTPTFVGTENSVGRAIAADTVAPSWVTRIVTNNTIGAGATNPSNWNLIRVYDNGSTGGVFAVNETVLASGLTVGANGIVDLVLAAQQGGASNWSDVDIAYVGVFYGDVSTSALWSAFKTWVTSKYGITLS